MRIQDTNTLMNEARIQRRAHALETGEFEEGTRNRQRINRARNLLRTRKVRAGLAGLAAAAIATTALLIFRSRKNHEFPF